MKFKDLRELSFHMANVVASAVSGDIDVSESTLTTYVTCGDSKVRISDHQGTRRGSTTVMLQYTAMHVDYDLDGESFYTPEDEAGIESEYSHIEVSAEQIQSMTEQAVEIAQNE